MDIFAPIVKINSAKREVYGVMAEEAPDRANEIFDYASSKPYVKAWVDRFSNATQGKSFGNVRGMHSAIAAGKLIGVTFDDQQKRIPVVARIVDDNEWNKVVEGVYNGFSIGGKYIKKWIDVPSGLTRYTADPTEVSIVDNPCMRGAMFTMVKNDGSAEMRKFSPRTSSNSLEAMIDELVVKVDDYLARRARAATAAKKFDIHGSDNPDQARDLMKAARAGGRPYSGSY